MEKYDDLKNKRFVRKEIITRSNDELVRGKIFAFFFKLLRFDFISRDIAFVKRK